MMYAENCTQQTGELSALFIPVGVEQPLESFPDQFALRVL